MDPDRPAYHPAYLFNLRLWREDLGDGATEWRGQVRSVETGDTRYFRDWPALVQFLLALARPGADRPPDLRAGDDGADRIPGLQAGDNSQGL